MHVETPMSFTTFNTFTPTSPPSPPQKKKSGFFWGKWGVAVLGYFYQFLTLGDKKSFGKNLEQVGTFEMFFWLNMGHFRSNNHN